MLVKCNYGLIVVRVGRKKCGAQAVVGTVKIGELTVDVDRDGVDELENGDGVEIMMVWC
jgi:hypothetical protein